MNPAHIATLEETIQVLESAIAHNTKMGRTILVHTQQERANRLKDVVKALTVQEAVKQPIAQTSPLAKAGDTPIYER